MIFFTVYNMYITVYNMGCIVSILGYLDTPATNMTETNDENKEQQNIANNTTISEEDRILLLRVKWLLKRFHDLKHESEVHAHTKSSLELMKDAAELTQRNLKEKSMHTAENIAKIEAGILEGELLVYSGSSIYNVCMLICMYVCMYV